MKAMIALSGNLVIEAENELEGYALRMWEQSNRENYDPNVAYHSIIIKDSVPVEVKR